MKTYWVCVASRWLVPPVACDARGGTEASARRHTEDHPRHPTVTTTRLELADQLAAQMQEHSA